MVQTQHESPGREAHNDYYKYYVSYYGSVNEAFNSA